MGRKNKYIVHCIIVGLRLAPSILRDFPDCTNVFSIGKSFEGRDINVLRIDASSAGSSSPAVHMAAKNNETNLL